MGLSTQADKSREGVHHEQESRYKPENFIPLSLKQMLNRELDFRSLVLVNNGLVYQTDRYLSVTRKIEALTKQLKETKSTSEYEQLLATGLAEMFVLSLDCKLAKSFSGYEDGLYSSSDSLIEQWNYHELLENFDKQTWQSIAQNRQQQTAAAKAQLSSYELQVEMIHERLTKLLTCEHCLDDSVILFFDKDEPAREQLLRCEGEPTSLSRAQYFEANALPILIYQDQMYRRPMEDEVKPENMRFKLNRTMQESLDFGLSPEQHLELLGWVKMPMILHQWDYLADGRYPALNGYRPTKKLPTKLRKLAKKVNTLGDSEHIRQFPTYTPWYNDRFHQRRVEAFGRMFDLLHK